MSQDEPRTRPSGGDDARLHEEAGRILLDAEGLKGPERERFLREACSGQAELLDLVNSLDRDLEGARGFLDDAPGSALREGLEERLESAAGGLETEPAALGSYRLLRRLAQGGMGTVYEAEQSSPRRRVAVKVIAPGMATPEVLRRFRLEGEVLARMSHPGIAKVLEVSEPGAAPPWFAMELVDGRPLTEHADAEELGIPERLALLAATCDAVAHAHSRGVVHRDLKPSNVLVDREGRPRVLDFGVARATGLEEQSSMLLTRTGDLVGTLAYMSPEQAWGRKDDIDARTDVHALGVLGFELLTGRLPRRLDELSFGEALHVLRDGEVDRAESVDPRLAGDPATILAKALESEPGRRYPSAAEMAADIRRCLRDEPIVARPPSAGYRAAKFLRRHRRLAAVTVTAFLALAAVTSLAVRSAVEASRASRAAERQAYRANLAAAAGALELGNVATARRRLAEAPEALRGWEWRVLFARTGGTSASRPLSGAQDLLLDEAGERAFVFVDEEDDAAAPRLVELSLPSLDTLGSRPLDPAGTMEVPRGLLGRVAAWLLGRESPAGDGPWSFLVDGRRVELRRPPEAGAGSVQVSPGAELAVLPLREGEGTALFELSTGLRLPDPEVRPGRFHEGAGRWLSEGIGRVELGGRERSGPPVSLAAPLTSEEGGARSDDDGFMSAVFAADGAGVYTASYGSAAYLRLWDASNGELLRTTAARARTSWGADTWAVAADGSTVAWSPGEGSVHVYDAWLRRRRALVHLPEPEALRRIELSGDGRRLAGLAGDQVHAWELAAAKVPGELRAHDSYVYHVDHDATGRRFATAGWDLRVRTWDAESLRLLTDLEVIRLDAGTDERPVEALFTPDGELAVVTNVGQVLILDPWSGRTLHRRVLPGFQGAPQLAVDPRGRLLLVASLSVDTPAVALSLDGLEPVAGFEGLTRTVAWSPDGRLLAGRAGETIRILERDGTVRSELALPAGTGELRLRWAYRTDRLLASDTKIGVLLYDTRAARLLLRLEAPEGGRTFDAALFPDGARIASGHEDGGVRIWDAKSGELLATWAGHGLYVRALSLSPDGRVLLSASGDRTVRRWDARGESERNRILAEREALGRRVEAVVLGLRAAGLGGEALIAALLEHRTLTEDERLAALAVAVRSRPDAPRTEDAR